MGMIMRTPPDVATIEADKFIDGVHNNMDESDSVEKIVTVRPRERGGDAGGGRRGCGGRKVRERERERENRRRERERERERENMSLCTFTHKRKTHTRSRIHTHTHIHIHTPGHRQAHGTISERYTKATHEQPA